MINKLIFFACETNFDENDLILLYNQKKCILDVKKNKEINPKLWNAQ